MLGSITPSTCLIIFSCSLPANADHLAQQPISFLFALTLRYFYILRKTHLFFWLAISSRLVPFHFYFWFWWHSKNLYSLFKQNISQRLLPKFLLWFFLFIISQVPRQVWHRPTAHTKGLEEVERTSFRTKAIKKCESENDRAVWSL